MRTLLPAAAIAAVATAVTGATALGLVMAPNPPARRAIGADVVIVGKVTGFEKDLVQAEPHPEVAAESVRRFDDSRLDHDLTDGDIDLAQQAPNFFQLARHVLNEYRVGARIDDRAAAL